MSNWYDRLDDAQIDELKANKIGSGLEPLWMQVVFCQIMDRSLEWWDSGSSQWLPTSAYDTSHTYRLSPDWARPEPADNILQHSVERAIADVGEMEEEKPNSIEARAKRAEAAPCFYDEFYEQRREERRWELFKGLVISGDGCWEESLEIANQAVAAYYDDKEGAE